MTPQGPRIARSLSCSDNVPAAELERIAGLYEQRISKTSFVGHFGERLPQDVGQYGIYEYLDDPMGQSYVYVERFKGNNNPAADVEEMLSMADRFIDFLLEWFEFELGEDENFSKLHLFLDTKVRVDLKNLCMYHWLDSRLVASETSHEEWSVRAFLHLLEQEYVTFNELFAIKEDPKRILPLVQNLLARELGYTDGDPASEKLDFLADPNAVNESLVRFIPASDRYQQAMEQAIRESPDPDLVSREMMNKPLRADDALELAMELYEIDILSFIDFSLSSDKLTIEMLCTNQPYATNGHWDPNSNRLTWSQDTKHDSKAQLSFLCYAHFSVPNEEFQLKHFGETVLQEEKLTRYCMWRQGLSQSRRQEWDTCLSSLQPDRAPSQIHTFRFSDEHVTYDQDGEPRKLASDVLRDLFEPKARK